MPSWVLSMDLDTAYKLPAQPVDMDSGLAISPGSFVSLVRNEVVDVK
jgi:hypothetical protein